MKRSLILIGIFAACWMSTVFASETCQPGEKRLDSESPCMPVQLVNYLYCLERSGGGKVEFTSKDSKDKASDLQLTLGGKASGIIVKGEGSGNLSKSDSERITKELQAKLDPSLVANCKAISVSGQHGGDNGGADANPTASKSILGGFGTRLEDVNKKVKTAVLKSDEDDTMYISYPQRLFGRDFTIYQDLDSQKKTGRALASLRLLGGDSWGSHGASENDTHSMCSHTTFQKILGNLITNFGAPADIKTREEWTTHKKDGGVKVGANFTLEGAAWKFSDGSRMVLRTRSRDVWRTFAKTEYHFECIVEVCAIPKSTEPCFTVSGLSM